jgi:hypothetical protein
MSGDYTPQPGDVVTFPAAPMRDSRTRRYVILQAEDHGWVTYRPEADEYRDLTYWHPLSRLRKIGITKETRS